MQNRMTATQTRWSAWDYHDPSWNVERIIGHHVEALDGEIGKIDKATNEVGGSYLIIDTGPWIFGKKVMLPAGVVSRVDSANERVFVNRTKEQIKNAPELDENRLRDAGYREEFGTYYGEGGRGWYDDTTIPRS